MFNSSVTTSVKGLGFGKIMLNWFKVFWILFVSLFKFEIFSLILLLTLYFSNVSLSYGILKSFSNSSSVKMSFIDIKLSAIVSPVLIRSKALLENEYILSPD